MFKGIKAFLLSVLTIGSLVATGNMAKSQETEVAEAATVNVTFEVDFTVVNNWNPNSDSDITDYRLHTDADVDYGCWDKTSENLSGTTNKNIKTRKLNISKGTNKMTLFVVYFRENGNLKQSYDVEDASLFASAKDGDTFSVTVDPKNWGKGDEANKFHGVTVAKKASEKGNQAWAITGTMYGWTTEPTQSEKFIWNKGTSRYEYSTYLRSNSEFKFINAPSGDFTKDTTNEAINWKAYEDLSGNGITTYLEDGDPDPLKTDSNIKVKTTGDYKFSFDEDFKNFKVETTTLDKATLNCWFVNSSTKATENLNSSFIVPLNVELTDEDLQHFVRKDGYRFEGWYKSSTLIESTKLKAGDKIAEKTTTIYGKYTPQTKTNYDFYIQFENATKWFTKTIYLFSNVYQRPNATFPGEDLLSASTVKVTNLGSDLYKVSVDTSYGWDNMVINNKADSRQTEDIDLSKVIPASEGVHRLITITCNDVDSGSDKVTPKFMDYYSTEDKAANKEKAIGEFDALVQQKVNDLEKYKNYQVKDKAGEDFLGKTTRQEIAKAIADAESDITKKVTALTKPDATRDSITEDELDQSKFTELKTQLETLIAKSNVKVYAQLQTGSADADSFTIRFLGTVDDINQNKPQYSSLGFKIVVKKGEKTSPEVPVYTNIIYTSVTYNGDDGFAVPLTTTNYDTAGFFLLTLTDIPSDVTEFEVTPFAKRIGEEVVDSDCGLKQTFKYVDGKIQRV